MKIHLSCVSQLFSARTLRHQGYESEFSLPTHPHSLAINPHLKLWISYSLPLPIMTEIGALFAASIERSLFIHYPLTLQSLCQHIIFQNSSYINYGVPHFQKCWTPYKHQRMQPTGNCMQTCKSE